MKEMRTALKRKTLALLVLGSLCLLLISVGVTWADPVAIKEAIDQGDISVQFTSTGSASGHIADLMITSNAGSNITLDLENSGLRGMVLENPRDYEQDEVITETPGVSIGPSKFEPTDMVTLGTGETVLIPVIGYCLNFDKDTPSTGIEFNLGSTSTKTDITVLGPVLSTIYNYQFPDTWSAGEILTATQMVIWVAQQENLNTLLQDYKDRGYSVTEDILAVVQDILIESGINTENIAVFNGATEDQDQGLLGYPWGYPWGLPLGIPLYLLLVPLIVLIIILVSILRRASRPSKDCQDLIDKCKKAREAAKAAEKEAQSAKQKAESANQDYEKAKGNVVKAQENLRDAQKEPSEEDQSWVEMDGRRITSQDLKLRKSASKALWDQYRQGDIDAKTLEKEWENLGEHEALEELRKKDREARKDKAEKNLEKAKAEAESAEAKAAKAKAEAESAEAKAAEVKAHADKICKEADDCLKAMAKAPKKPPSTKVDEAPEGEPEAPDEPPEETPETTLETDRWLDTTGTTFETMTYTTEETEKLPTAPIGDTTVFGPRLGEPGLTPITPQEPSVELPPKDTTTTEESSVQRCGPDATTIYLKALNEIASRLRHEYRSAPGGAWTDFWGARSAYGISFLLLNGWEMDFWPKSVGDCPSYPKCDYTVTLLGECVVAHTLNDLIYGLCAGFFGVPEFIQKTGGHFAELIANKGLDPKVSQQIYQAGTELGETIRHKPVTIDASDLAVTVMRIHAIKRFDCTPCMKPATGTDRDFSKKKWTWP